MTLKRTAKSKLERKKIKYDSGQMIVHYLVLDFNSDRNALTRSFTKNNKISLPWAGDKIRA